MLNISATVASFTFNAEFARHASYARITSDLNGNDQAMRILFAGAIQKTRRLSIAEAYCYTVVMGMVSEGNVLPECLDEYVQSCLVLMCLPI